MKDLCKEQSPAPGKPVDDWDCNCHFPASIRVEGVKLYLNAEALVLRADHPTTSDEAPLGDDLSLSIDVNLAVGLARKCSFLSFCGSFFQTVTSNSYSDA